MLVLGQVHSNLHCGLFFFPRAVAHILNTCIAACAVVVVVVVVVSWVLVIVVIGHNIVTCTV